MLEMQEEWEYRLIQVISILTLVIIIFKFLQKYYKFFKKVLIKWHLTDTKQFLSKVALLYSLKLYYRSLIVKLYKFVRNKCLNVKKILKYKFVGCQWFWKVIIITNC